MPFISREGLKKLLFTHVVELKTLLRHPKPDTKTRRYFCVGAYPNFHNNPFLNTTGAQTTLRYRYPKGFPPYHPRPYYDVDQKNLVITWDIFKQDYRCINIRNCNVIRAFPVDTPQKMKEFWSYFNKSIVNMTTEQKQEFFKK